MSGRPVARTFDQRLAVISKWGEILLRNVVPICEKDNRGHTQGHGTGLLVQRGEANFLVTAAHVLDPLRDQRRLFFPCAQSGERKIVGRILSTETPVGKSRKEDLVDIAVVKLDGESQPPYPEIQKESLEFSCLRPSVLPRSGKSLFVTGFPATRTKTHILNKNVELRPYANMCSSIADDKYPDYGLKPEAHIALSFDVKKVYGKGARPIQAPDPAGMSGAPIWLLFDHTAENHPTKNEVIGVVIEHRRAQKLLVGTDISVAVELIAKLS